MTDKEALYAAYGTVPPRAPLNTQNSWGRYCQRGHDNCIGYGQCYTYPAITVR